MSTEAKHSNLDIARFLQIATSFPSKVRKELLTENNADELAAMSKRKEHCQRSADSLRTPEFVRRVHGMAWHSMARSSVDADKSNLRESFNACKTTLKQIEAPRRTGCLGLFSDQNNFHQDERVNPDAHVETLLTTVVKPCIDNATNGGRPCVFQ
ncbi:hypothetical protein ACTXT7_013284 [Hymenolepis weldensis]